MLCHTYYMKELPYSQNIEKFLKKYKWSYCIFKKIIKNNSVKVEPSGLISNYSDSLFSLNLIMNDSINFKIVIRKKSVRMLIEDLNKTTIFSSYEDNTGIRFREHSISSLISVGKFYNNNKIDKFIGYQKTYYDEMFKFYRNRFIYKTKKNTILKKRGLTSLSNFVPLKDTRNIDYEDYLTYLKLTL